MIRINCWFFDPLTFPGEPVDGALLPLLAKIDHAALGNGLIASEPLQNVQYYLAHEGDGLHIPQKPVVRLDRLNHPHLGLATATYVLGQGPIAISGLRLRITSVAHRRRVVRMTSAILSRSGCGSCGAEMASLSVDHLGPSAIRSGLRPGAGGT